MKDLSSLLLKVLTFLCLVTLSQSFTSQCGLRNSQSESLSILHATSRQRTSTSTASSSSKLTARRKELLSRTGPYLKLDRLTGKIAFGSTVNLVTRLDTQPNPELIAEWLSDERALALSIWDEKLMKELGNSVYQLQTMKLQFVTIQLAPTVDMKMKTSFIQGDKSKPVFQLQSIGFDPNIQLLPGISMSPEALGVTIEVAGELRPTPDGMGVTGRIAFETQGNLPPPMRLLPEQALKSATEGINQPIVNFAVKSFQKGAIAKYREFRKSKQLPIPK